MNKDRMPDFIIIGAGKSGTSSLFENLSRHPKIQRPKKTPPKIGVVGHGGKELRFFSRNYALGWEWYEDRFPKRLTKSHLLFEATPMYVFRPGCVAERMKALVPGIKTIMIMRNPTDRAWSEYAGALAHDPYKHDINRLSSGNYSPVKRGVYIDQIMRWHRHFPKDSLLLLRAEDYFSDAHSTLRRVYEFVGVDEVYPDEISHLDPWREQKKAFGAMAMPDDVRSMLDWFYAPHNERLSEYLGEDWTWRESWQ